MNPLYYVTFTSATLVASFILFKGFNTTDIVNTLSLISGFLITFTGVYLLNLSRQDPNGNKMLAGNHTDVAGTDMVSTLQTRRSMQSRRSMGSRHSFSSRSHTDRDGLMRRADGNGFSLNSEKIRGLGVILRFIQGTTNITPYRPPIIPTVYADKMMCGRLPIDPNLARAVDSLDEILMTAQEGNACRESTSDMLRNLQLKPNDEKEYLIDVDQRTKGAIWIHPPYNECIELLAPFMPYKGCRLTRFDFCGGLRGCRDRCFYS